MTMDPVNAAAEVRQRSGGRQAQQPLFYGAMVLQGLSEKEPLAVAQLDELLEQKTQGDVRLGAGIHQAMQSLLERRLIVAGEEKLPGPKRGGHAAQPYRRTALGIKASIIYEAAVGAIYSPEGSHSAARVSGAIALPRPATMPAIVLEFLEVAKAATAVRLLSRLNEVFEGADVARFLLGASSQSTLARVGGALRSLAKADLARLAHKGSEHTYTLTAEGVRTAVGNRQIVCRLFGYDAPPGRLPELPAQAPRPCWPFAAARAPG